MQRFDQPPPRVHGPRDSLRRITRWLSLTLIHQAIWPALLLVAGRTMDRPSASSSLEILGMISGPIAAALLAWAFMRSAGANLPGDPVASIAAGQARLIALGLPLMVLLARLIRGDADATWKIAVFGAASVAAFHLIHFGVARSMFPSPVLITMLFGISWAIHQIADALARDTGGSFVLHAISGFTAGVLVAVASQVLQRWPGGRLTAPAVHWLVIYLILGFSQ